DVAYFAHKDTAPRKLVRSSDVNWSISAQVFKDGPYLKQDTQGTTLSLAGYNSFVPAMTSNTSPSGVASTSSGSTSAYQVFDKNASTAGVLTSAPTGWVQYQATSAKVCDAYWLQAGSLEFRSQDMPTTWTLEGSN